MSRLLALLCLTTLPLSIASAQSYIFSLAIDTGAGPPTETVTYENEVDVAILMLTAESMISETIVLRFETTCEESETQVGNYYPGVFPVEINDCANFMQTCDVDHQVCNESCSCITSAVVLEFDATNLVPGHLYRVADLRTWRNANDDSWMYLTGEGWGHDEIETNRIWMLSPSAPVAEIGWGRLKARYRGLGLDSDSR